ncbi:hypothetical protein, partial [Turicimonas muris]|uniref:hypothetical protein n=2 Tax=Turicimonas muris TaxID=1796652 RepID=UPI0025B69AF3
LPKALLGNPEGIVLAMLDQALLGYTEPSYRKDDDVRYMKHNCPASWLMSTNERLPSSWDGYG